MKKGTIAGFVLGVIVGAAGFWGGQFAMSNMGGSSEDAKKIEAPEQQRLSLFDQVDEDPNGNFYITSSTRTYHRRTCPWLENATRIKRISYNDVVVYNITPCSKCQK